MTTQPQEEVKTQVERRYFPRKKFHASIEIEWGSAGLNGTVRDIGPRGLFIEVTPPLWLGAAFRARLMVNPVLVIDCKVVRVEPGGGVAVTYEVVDNRDKAQLEELLLSLPAT